MHKAPYYVNRQPCGMWVDKNHFPYGNGKYTGPFVDYNQIKSNGHAESKTNGSTNSGWIYTYDGPLASGKG